MGPEGGLISPASAQTRLPHGSTGDTSWNSERGKKERALQYQVMTKLCSHAQVQVEGAAAPKIERETHALFPFLPLSPRGYLPRLSKPSGLRRTGLCCFQLQASVPVPVPVCACACLCLCRAEPSTTYLGCSLPPKKEAHSSARDRLRLRLRLHSHLSVALFRFFFLALHFPLACIVSSLPIASPNTPAIPFPSLPLACRWPVVGQPTATFHPLAASRRVEKAATKSRANIFLAKPARPWTWVTGKLSQNLDRPPSDDP